MVSPQNGLRPDHNRLEAVGSRTRSRLSVGNVEQDGSEDCRSLPPNHNGLEAITGTDGKEGSSVDVISISAARNCEHLRELYLQYASAFVVSGRFLDVEIEHGLCVCTAMLLLPVLFPTVGRAGSNIGGRVGDS